MCNDVYCDESLVNMAVIDDDGNCCVPLVEGTTTPTVEEQKENECAVRPPRTLRTLKLTTAELVHLRALMSIRLPSQLTSTVSQSLAAKEERPLTETSLWVKVANACSESDIPIGEEAPDFIVGVTGLPDIKVFEIAAEPINGGYQVDDKEEEERIVPFGKNNV